MWKSELCVVGPIAGVGVLEKIKSSCLCLESNHDSQVISPERSHYTIHTTDIPPLAAHSGSYLGIPVHSINEIAH
jgi:hypothetical protein